MTVPLNPSDNNESSTIPIIAGGINSLLFTCPASHCIPCVLTGSIVGGVLLIAGVVIILFSVIVCVVKGKQRKSKEAGQNTNIPTTYILVM